MSEDSPPSPGPYLSSPQRVQLEPSHHQRSGTKLLARTTSRSAAPQPPAEQSQPNAPSVATPLCAESTLGGRLADRNPLPLSPSRPLGRRDRRYCLWRRFAPLRACLREVLEQNATDLADGQWV